jgi:hypothetical protein
MLEPKTADVQAGISAVLMPCRDLDGAVLDLAAVLGGLVGERFEIILVCSETPNEVAGLQARAPHLPLRVVAGTTCDAGCKAARYDLLFVAAGDGQFDVRELNHLFDAVELGVDVVVGYRPRRIDALVRRLPQWGRKSVEVDCAFALLRSRVWAALAPAAFNRCRCAELISDARQLGYRVAEVPVSNRRPAIGIPVALSSHAA